MPDEEEAIEKPQQEQTPFQRAWEAIRYSTGEADKAAEEQIVWELVQYLEENNVTIGTSAALALTDIMALNEAEIGYEEPDHLQIPYHYLQSESQRITVSQHLLTEYLETSLKQFIAALPEKIRSILNIDLYRIYNAPWRTHKLSLENMREALAWVRWKDIEEDNPLWYKSPVPRGEEIYTTPYRVITKDMLDDLMKLLLRIEARMFSTMDDQELKTPDFGRVQRTPYDDLKDMEGNLHRVERPEKPVKQGQTEVVSHGEVIQEFYKTLEDYTTYAVIKREIARSKFMLPGYWEAYQKIKAWSDTLVDMKYKREIVGLKSAKRPHERDKSYARASGKFHAIRLLTSLSEDILAGSFAFNGQSEVDDD